MNDWEAPSKGRRASSEHASARSDPRRPLPEQEFPVWLMRTSVQRIGRAAEQLIAGPQYKRLARFSADMRTCSRSSLDMTKALELCLKPHASSRLGQCWVSAVSKVRQGSTLAEALQPAQRLLPAFYLPVVQAGEESGRLEEAFEFLERHCRMLSKPVEAVRNLWLFPLCIMIAGVFIKVAMNLVMGSFLGAAGVLFYELGSFVQLLIMVAIVMLTPLRRLVDQLKLTLPWVGELEREIALNRFFRVMALLYGVGGERVDAMIRTAAKTIANQVARDDVLKAAVAVEHQATVSEAFHQVSLLRQDDQGMIDVGELSGTLEQSFDQIADQAESSMMAKLELIQPFLNRIVMATVAFSIVVAMFQLIAG